MTILRDRKTWRKPPPAVPPQRKLAELTVEEQVNVRRALQFMRARAGSWEKLAAAMRIIRKTIETAGTSGKPSIATTFRAARFAEVKIDDMLSGAWPPEGACPTCGRCG